MNSGDKMGHICLSHNNGDDRPGHLLSDKIIPQRPAAAANDEHRVKL